MRTSRILPVACQLVALLCVSAPLAASTPAELYQEGLTRETAEGDLEAAIAIFEKIVEEHGDDAAVAANAQLHIGMCHEKLGRSEARSAYERVIARFPDEREVVEQARERLQALEEAAEARRPQAGAGPAKTAEMMEKLERQRARVESYRGSMAITIEAMGRSITSEGPMLFRRPDHLRFEMTAPPATGRITTVFDGNTSWTHHATGNLVSVIDVAALASDFPEYGNRNSVYRPFQGLEGGSIRYIRSDRIDGEEVYVFQGKPDQTVATKMSYGQAVPDWIEIAVAASDGLTRKLVAYRDTGAEMMKTEMVIDEVNVAIPDSAFVFSQPEGAQVMDMTETVRNLYAQAAAGELDGEDGESTGGASAGSIIEEIEEARSAVTSYRAETERQMHMMGAMMTHNATEWHQGEERSRQEMTSSMMPGVTISIRDSGVMWTYMPAMKLVQRIDASRVKQELGENGDEEKPETFHGMLKDSVIFVGMENLEGEEVYLLEGQSSGGMKALTGIEFGRIRAWIGVGDGLVRKKVVYDKQGEEVMVETRTNVEVNVDIPDSLFTFTPPEGVQVMDMTDGAIKAARDVQARSHASEGEGE